MRYNDIDNNDETPFVDNAVKPPTINTFRGVSTKDCNEAEVNGDTLIAVTTGKVD